MKLQSGGTGRVGAQGQTGEQVERLKEVLRIQIGLLMMVDF